MPTEHVPPIYLDNAATTRVLREVCEIMSACCREDFGNPSSAHRMGIAATQRLKTARESLLAALGGERAGRDGKIAACQSLDSKIYHGVA